MPDRGYTLLQNLKMELRLFFYSAENKGIEKIAAVLVDEKGSVYL